jgi:hypothetical protein
MAAQGATLRVEGYRELVRAFATADKEQRRELRATLKQVGDVVRVDAVRRFSPVNSRSAAGYRTRVRQKGVAVEQSLRKTTGAHPEWGSYQMRHALLPALMSSEDDTERAMEHAMDRVADHFNRGGI